ncbi:hypothetical protein [Micromonospora echinospora]|uniref:hypothetical protein n=1 Tax=Micromonospora echinospora TaxID=1877 RepID=UPI00117F4DE5|nr:hypothetical protein [Micromonospora echinospora]
MVAPDLVLSHPGQAHQQRDASFMVRSSEAGWRERTNIVPGAHCRDWDAVASILDMESSSEAPIRAARQVRRHGRWGAITHRTLLDALAASVPATPFAWADAALVTGLLRPVPWDCAGHWASVASTIYAQLAIRTARVIRTAVPEVTTTCQPSRRAGAGRASFEVLVPASELKAATDLLQQLRTSLPGKLHRQCPDAMPLARTVWRTSLLVSSSDRRRTQLRVRVPDALLSDVLVRAGRLLDVDVRHHRARQHVHVVTVDDPRDAVTVLRAVGAGPRAEAWVQAIG